MTRAATERPSPTLPSEATRRAPLAVAAPRLPAALGRRHPQPGRHPADHAGAAGPGRQGAATPAPFQMGLLAALRVPGLPRSSGCPAGAWVDRWRKKRVLMTGDVVRAVALGVAAAGLGARRADLRPDVRRRLVVGLHGLLRRRLPELPARHRRPEHIVEGNAKLQAIQSVAMIGGPGVGGGLLGSLGARCPWPWTRSASLLSALLRAAASSTSTPRPPREDRRPLRVEIREGLSFVLRHPLLVADHGVHVDRQLRSARWPARCSCCTP